MLEEPRGWGSLHLEVFCIYLLLKISGMSKDFAKIFRTFDDKQLLLMLTIEQDPEDPDENNYGIQAIAHMHGGSVVASLTMGYDTQEECDTAFLNLNQDLADTIKKGLIQMFGSEDECECCDHE